MSRREAARAGARQGGATAGRGAQPSDGAEAAARIVWLGLIMLAIARAVLAFVPSMWGWGLNLMRFTAPVPAWTLWALAALALVPAVARKVLAMLEALS